MRCIPYFHLYRLKIYLHKTKICISKEFMPRMFDEGREKRLASEMKGKKK
jgi:hypothetical protein